MRNTKTLLLPFLLLFLWALPAHALTGDVSTRDASVVGESFTFRSTATDAVGVVQYRWNFGDGIRTEFDPAGAEVSHVYTMPNHYSVLLSMKDESGAIASVPFTHTVRYPLTAKRPVGTTSIVYDKARGRVYSVNQDNDTITSIDVAGLTKLAEVAVYRRPEALALAPDGKLWVLHRDDYAVAVVDPEKFVVERGFRLPYASQPMGLAFSPSGDAAYITLMAVGKLLKVNPTSGETIATLDVGAWPRGVSVSGDGKDVFVSRFISSMKGGEVVRIDGPSMKVTNRFVLGADTTTVDSDLQSRGLPNYLFSVGLSPDGKQAWIPGKKDNILRGTFLDNKPLNQDDTVRPLIAVLDLAESTERPENRIDLDDRNLPSHVEFSPDGDYAFVTITGSSFIEVRDTYTRAIATVAMGAGLGPRASVLGPKNQLFVQGFLSRDVVVFDLTDLLVAQNKATPKLVTKISTVGTEKLDAKVLLGKQVFYNSGDSRMTIQGYLSCATCHFDGFEDGRVYDFTSRGEGLRNTTSLLGRRGTGQGRIDWSGNFDEIQDFESTIRDLFLGHGFIPDDVLAVGTRKDPLGEKKEGLSKELDALAAFVTSLDHVNPSPFRNPDGSMTADAQAGRALFGKLGCGFCHVGADFTDSVRGMLHDVGTLKPSSGTRSGAALTGIDTPTLLGIWETAPYLHDGSAATLRDVLTTSNANDLHGFVSGLKPQEIDQLVAYMEQLDGDLSAHRLPFEPPAPLVDAGTEAGGRLDGGGTVDARAGDAHPGIKPSPPGAMGSCSCALTGGPASTATGVLSLFAGLLAWCRWRQRARRDAGERPRTDVVGQRAEGQP